jgi:titin
MSANAVSNTVSIQLGTPTRPANPTSLVATMQTGPQVSLTWVDKANNESGFVIQRCAGSGCTNFVDIATRSGASPGINGSITYVDTTVTFNTTYRYQVYAANSFGLSAAPTPPVSVTIPILLPAPTNFTVAVAVVPNSSPRSYRATSTWNWATANPTNFTIQRATNSAFTTGLLSSPIAPGMRINNQIVSPATTYYYRIRANNAAGSSPWVNALPFPIRTGN